VATLIERPTIIKAAGTPPKVIQEFIGRVNSDTEQVSVARMISPPGWTEPAQAPEFNEYTLVLKGSLHVAVEGRVLVVNAGQAVIVQAGERVQYRTPEGAEYLAVCVPAFAPHTVHREEG
jgi:quercetin dioxygenase-like cupin family protein